MFSSDRTRLGTPELAAADEAAFKVLTDAVEGLRGVSPFEDADAMIDVIGCWSSVHGFAELLPSDRLVTVRGLERAERETVLRRTLEKAMD